MTAFSLEPSQLAWCAELRALAAERLRPSADKGEPGRVNRALVAELGSLGLLGRLFTSGALDLCLMRESLAYACTEAETALALQGLGAHPVHACGTQAQRDRWLPRVTAGTAIAAFALSEPGAGSDAVALQLRAEADTDLWAGRSSDAAGRALRVGETGGDREGGRSSDVVAGAQRAQMDAGLRAGPAPDAAGRADAQADPRDDPASQASARALRPGARAASRDGRGSEGTALTAAPDGPARWRLTGEKCWISNAPEADFYTVFARTTPGAGARGVTAFLVPADRPGLTGRGLDMLSPHPIGALDFDAVPVTADDVLGEPDRGFRVAMGTLNLFRPSVGAFAVGMAQAALDATLAHTAGRDAFGGRLKDLQAVAHQVAEMALRTEAARLMVHASASAYDAGAPDVPRRSAMAKLLATETAQYVVDAAVQLHGARALQRGHLLEHLYREVRAPRIYEGASEVQRGIIAKDLYARQEAR
ncbi:acyl-CoA dehydrogenase [Streptomyces sp. NRRL B-1140]|uniref:acyl-CoA dehydrogenase family protein n=1 Tax=Streptomyces sp. NRRL B-1140 TaxID=1415549 RepID=UPI0006AEAEF3|nr:acyl-CoA dehydrogenase family protein [Streptomyces sp. NRRL B-1140]KOX06578.1 acyl-CoA dehydrogenase [Streptomyces sp. NRRL B-1140]